MQVTIAGSGGWGTALAILLHENGHDVTLWSHFETESKQLAETHQNPYLPGVTLPEGLHYSADPACAQSREMVVFATPSFAVRTTARAFAPYLAETPLLVSVTKGIEEGTGYRMSELVSQETGRTVVALSGPSHAEEVSRGIPTGVVVACPERELAERVQNAFMCAASASTPAPTRPASSWARRSRTSSPSAPVSATAWAMATTPRPCS